MFAALLVCRTLCAVLQELHGGREGRGGGVGVWGLGGDCMLYAKKKEKKGPFQREHFWQVISHLASSTLTCTLESAHNQKMVLNEGWDGGRGGKKKIVILHLESSTNSSA